MAEKKSIAVEEIRKHSSPSDVWIVVDEVVWDVTSFAPLHPGGSAIIYKYAGRDATKAYSEIHAPSLIAQNLDSSKRIGYIDQTSLDAEWTKTSSSSVKEIEHNEKPPLNTMVNSYDFEAVASQTLTKKAWAFYSSAATDLITREANKTFLDRIWFRPRALIDVKNVSTKSRILGCDVSMPLFVAPAALAKLAHPDGEKAIALGCAKTGIAQCISTNASFPLAEVITAAPSGTPFFFQLYVNSDRAKSKVLLAEAEHLKVKAIFVTIDTPVPGKREADERVKADEALSAPMGDTRASNDAKGGGIARIMGSFIDSSLNWDDLKWIRGRTKLPLVLKGVQSAADARMAMEFGCSGILVSNHGGRNLDTAPPSILTLLEIHKQCPEVFDQMEVYIDSGIRRGTDILKALCLGATAVGIGRPFLYALSYGEEGIAHLAEIFRDELEVSMKLLGITDISQAHPGLTNTLDIDHLVPGSKGHPWIRWRSTARL